MREEDAQYQTWYAENGRASSYHIHGTLVDMRDKVAHLLNGAQGVSDIIVLDISRIKRAIVFVRKGTIGPFRALLERRHGGKWQEGNAAERTELLGESIQQ
jgi:hypothetical protein